MEKKERKCGIYRENSHSNGVWFYASFVNISLYSIVCGSNCLVMHLWKYCVNPLFNNTLIKAPAIRFLFLVSIWFCLWGSSLFVLIGSVLWYPYWGAEWCVWININTCSPPSTRKTTTTATHKWNEQTKQSKHKMLSSHTILIWNCVYLIGGS